MVIWLIIYIILFIYFIYFHNLINTLDVKNQNLSLQNPISIGNINLSKVYKDQNQHCAILTSY
jgi:hypothetical protein